LADLFGALKMRLSFSHGEIMELPFILFLEYLNFIGRAGKQEDPQVAKWRANALKWRSLNLPKG
jgi:hypothetical protein